MQLHCSCCYGKIYQGQGSYFFSATLFLLLILFYFTCYSISWEYNIMKEISLDDYESTRPPRRLRKEMVLPRDFREDILTDEQKQNFIKEKELDFAYNLQGVGRFRINYFMQRGSDAIVIHAITTDIKTPDELGLPPHLKSIVLEDKGLILVVGSAGSGKIP